MPPAGNPNQLIRVGAGLADPEVSVPQFFRDLPKPASLQTTPHTPVSIPGASAAMPWLKPLFHRVTGSSVGTMSGFVRRSGRRRPPHHTGRSQTQCRRGCSDEPHLTAVPSRDRARPRLPNSAGGPTGNCRDSGNRQRAAREVGKRRRRGSRFKVSRTCCRPVHSSSSCDP
jgi:hypothetical protein